MRFAPAVSALFPAAITSPTLRVAAAFIVVLVICLVLFALVSLLLTQLVAQESGADGTDRTLGALFGLPRGVVILRWR